MEYALLFFFLGTFYGCGVRLSLWLQVLKVYLMMQQLGLIGVMGVGKQGDDQHV